MVETKSQNTQKINFKKRKLKNKHMTSLDALLIGPTAFRSVDAPVEQEEEDGSEVSISLGVMVTRPHTLLQEVVPSACRVLSVSISSSSISFFKQSSTKS